MTDGAQRVVRRGVAILAALLAPLFLLAQPLAGQAQNESKVKAAYVFNLTKYVEWPAASSDVVICVAGGGPMQQALGELAGKTSDSRRIVVLVEPGDGELKRCDLLYITYSSGKKIQDILQKLPSSSTLTVGEVAAFTRAGGMIGLLTVGDRVPIEVNLGACQKAKLKVSSRLLSLARIVGSDRVGG